MMSLFDFPGLYGAQPMPDLGADRTAASAQSKAAAVERKTRLLEANLAKVLLICESLWELVKDQHGLTDEQLKQKITEVDMRDGTLDGKNQRKAVECPSCGHMVSARHPACLYCGCIIDDSVFRVG